MSKKSVMVMVLALALILVGTGYAYWTDALDITTKATTGDLDVTFVDLGLYAQYDIEDEANNWSIVDGIPDATVGYVPSDYFNASEGLNAADFNTIADEGAIEQYYDEAEGYNSVEFDAELVNGEPIHTTVDVYAAGEVIGSDSILITVQNMYPGYAQAFRTDIINQGTIGAKLANINFDVTAIAGVENNEVTKDMLGIALLIEHELTDDDGVWTEGHDVFLLAETMGQAGLTDDDFFMVGNVEFVRLSALEDLSFTNSDLADHDFLFALPYFGRMDAYLAVGMDPDAEGVYTSGSTAVMSGHDDTQSMNKGLQISVQLLWDQFNEGVEIENTNILDQQNRQP